MKISHYKSHLGFFTFFLGFFLFFSMWWHGDFTGYELEIAKSTSDLINGTILHTRQGWSAVLLYLPFCLAMKILGFPFQWLSLVPHFYMAITLTIILLIFKEIFNPDKKLQIITTILIGVSTVMWPTTNHGMEVHGMFFLSLIILSFIKWEKNHNSVFPLAVSTVLFVNCKAYGLVFIPGVLIPMILHLKTKKQLSLFFTKHYLLLFFLPLLLCPFSFLETAIHENSIYGMHTPNELGVIISDWWEGFFGIIFSIGKGIIPLNPVLILCLIFWPNFHSKHKSLSECILTVTILIYIINSLSRGWSDERWISRGMPMAIPFLTFPLYYVLSFFKQKSWSLLKKSSVILILAFSIYIQLLGTLYPYWTTRVILRDSHSGLDSKEMMRYVPTLTPTYFHHRLLMSFLFGDYSESFQYYIYREIALHRHAPEGPFHSLVVDLRAFHTPPLWWLK